jgi:hypothetical protein
MPRDSARLATLRERSVPTLYLVLSTSKSASDGPRSMAWDFDCYVQHGRIGRCQHFSISSWAENDVQIVLAFESHMLSF